MNIFTTFWGRCFQQPKHRLKAQFVDEASAVELARQRKERLSLPQRPHHTSEILKGETQQGVLPVRMASLNVSSLDDVVREVGDGLVEVRDGRHKDHL